MTATLQDAIAAVRAGETERAQLLAAEVIENNPDDAHAWYLLSQLVESDGRRAAYLSRVLTLDPSHERARAEFDALPAEASAVLPVPAPVAITVAAAEEPVELVVGEVEAMPEDEPEHVPDWLHQTAPEPTPVAVAPVYEAEAVAVATPPAPPPARPSQPPAVTAPRPAPRATTPPPPPAQPRGNGALTALLVLLGLLTLAVLAILAYLLLF